MGAFVLVAVFGFFAALVILRGVVLSYLWAWFIVPLGADPIGIAHAIGLSLLIAMFTAHLKQDDDTGKGGDALAKLGNLFAKMVGQCAFAFGMGYLLSWIVVA